MSVKDVGDTSHWFRYSARIPRLAWSFFSLFFGSWLEPQDNVALPADPFANTANIRIVEPTPTLQIEQPKFPGSVVPSIPEVPFSLLPFVRAEELLTPPSSTEYTLIQDKFDLLQQASVASARGFARPEQLAPQTGASGGNDIHTPETAVRGTPTPGAAAAPSSDELVRMASTSGRTPPAATQTFPTANTSGATPLSASGYGVSAIS